MTPNKVFIVITGRPGIGKTTLVKRVVSKLVHDGIRVVGFYCPEVREGGKRIGFQVTSIDGTIRGWLARVTGCDGPRVGRYTTCYEAEKVVEEALRNLDKADLVVIDEIGPMELKLRGIRSQILRVLKSLKPGIFVAHYRLSDQIITPLLRQYGYWFEVTLENSDQLVDKIYSLTKNILAGRREYKA
jgi:nucleoside-triphosphatase